MFIILRPSKWHHAQSLRFDIPSNQPFEFVLLYSEYIPGRESCIGGIILFKSDHGSAGVVAIASYTCRFIF